MSKISSLLFLLIVSAGFLAPPAAASAQHRLHADRRAVRRARDQLRVARVRYRRARKADHASAQGVFEDCPVSGFVRFSDDFGDPRPGGRVHEGIDMPAPEGRDLVAVFAGTVTPAPSLLGGLGIDLRASNGDVAYYAHLSSYSATGKVAAGSVVGRVGSTGDATGPHLHFEYHPQGGEAGDPFRELMAVC